MASQLHLSKVVHYVGWNNFNKLNISCFAIVFDMPTNIVSKSYITNEIVFLLRKSNKAELSYRPQEQVLFAPQMHDYYNLMIKSNSIIDRCFAKWLRNTQVYNAVRVRLRKKKKCLEVDILKSQMIC